MNFQKWMVNQGLSSSSALKYNIAIKGVLSKLANESSITSKNLLEIFSTRTYLDIEEQIRKLPQFISRDEAGKGMYGSALNQYSNYLEDLSKLETKLSSEKLLPSEEVSETEFDASIKARIGQDQFRSSLVKLWGCCSISKYTNLSMLKASHIKPWKDSSNLERLDKYNGFLLLPNYDCAFDNGMISFEDDGRVLISSKLEEPEKVGISENLSINLFEENKFYLSFHRANIFMDK